MTILWCGGEDIDFPYPTVIANNTWNEVHWDTSLSRIAIWGFDLPTAKWGVPFPSISDNCWLSINFNPAWNALNSRWAGLIDSSTQTSVKGIYIGSSGYSGSAYKMAIYKWDGTTQTKLAEENSYSLPTSTRGKFDINIVNYGSNSEIYLYYNGNLIASYAGDSTISGVDSFNSVAIGPNTSIWLWISQIIVANEDTRVMVLKTIYPNGAGDTNGWTGTYTDVDEIHYSDSDKIYSGTSDADFQCNLTGMPTGSWAVKAVKVAARCVNGSGTNGIAVGVKTNDTVSVSDAMSCSGYWQTKELLLNTNPVTGNPWTPAEIEALQLNLRCKAV